MTQTSGPIVIAGGSGFLGRNLAHHLGDVGRDVVILSRHVPKIIGPWRHVAWDGRSLGPWTAALDGAAALVNLAGRTVDCIKTMEHRDEILRSRVESTRVLGAALRNLAKPPPVWVQMSTAHIYGDPPEVMCDEDAAFGHGLAPEVGRAWEAEHARGLPDGMRSVVLRTSFVLGRQGGALPKLAGLARAFLGGRVGHGRQGMSWIHERDMNALIARAIDDPAMRGVYVATAPEPVSNTAFMRELRRAVGRPFGLPAASWMVRIAAPLLMRTDPELALYGRYCTSRRLAEEGFEFAFPTLGPALRDLCA
ncbi:MAG: TIGR01777 family oxidoreductase [Planctomycetota bacterium]